MITGDRAIRSTDIGTPGLGDGGIRVTIQDVSSDEVGRDDSFDGVDVDLVCGIELRQRRGVKRLVRAIQPTEPPLTLVHPGVRGRWDAVRRQLDPTPHIPLVVTREDGCRPFRGERERRRHRRWRPVVDPANHMVKRGVKDMTERHTAELWHVTPWRPWLRRGQQPPIPQRIHPFSLVLEEDVDMRAPGDLPLTERLGVRLPVSGTPGHVGLGHDLEDLDVLVITNLTTPAVHHDSIEHRVAWVDVVQIRRKPAGRLRVPDRQDPLGSQPLEDARRPRPARGLPNRGEQVIGQRVTFDRSTDRHIERVVTWRAPLAKIVHANTLRRHPHPGVSSAHKVRTGLEPVDVQIATTRHVEPLDDNGPVEPLRRCRPPHDEPRLVGVTAVENVAGLQLRCGVSIRGTLDKELFLDVAV